jgi:hypothetical protein
MLIGIPSKTLPIANRNRATTSWGNSMTQEPTRTFDQAMVSVWEDELKATRDSSLKQQLSYREDELLPRLAAPYQQLKALRRRVRRSSQRKWKQSRAGIALLRALG